jgi:serine/threonine protein kinase
MNGYIKLDLIGKTERSEVYHVKKDDKDYAMKITKDDSWTEEEIRNLSTLNHPYIVKFNSSFNTTSGRYIIMELCQTKTLMSLNIDLKDKIPYLKQGLEALKYIHANWIIHRDLKMTNIFIGYDNNLRIGDFSLSIPSRDNLKGDFVGCYEYLSPEVKMKKSYSYKSDIWALGVCYYKFLTGNPFELYPKDLVEPYKNLLSDMLCIDPDDRPLTGYLLKNKIFTLV